MSVERWRRFGRGRGESVCKEKGRVQVKGVQAVNIQEFGKYTYKTIVGRKQSVGCRVYNIREGASFLPVFVRMLLCCCHERDCFVVLLSREGLFCCHERVVLLS